jgi:glyoxylase-like metal-dependent hydrolase (beta-lactamase superfamily II)
MNELERELDYVYGEAVPELGRSIELLPGIRWIRMTLPFALNHVNLWLLRDRIDDDGRIREGWSVVDCGIASSTTKAAWEQVFANELDGLPVLRVIVTHMHPDHIGLAAWLTERWDARLWISATDYNTALLASRGLAGFGGAESAAFMASHGLADANALEQIAARSDYYVKLVPSVPTTFRRLIDGGIVRIGNAPEGSDWTCLAGYGHAPEHIALYNAARNVLISGDMVLPRISTNVSVIDVEPEANPLALYLGSIEKMRALPADALVLPSHGLPFKGLHTRIDQLQQHHADRFRDVLDACERAPQSAADLLTVLFKRPLDLHQTTFAMGESIAHLHALWLGERLERRFEGGVFRFAKR